MDHHGSASSRREEGGITLADFDSGDTGEGLSRNARTDFGELLPLLLKKI